MEGGKGVYKWQRTEQTSRGTPWFGCKPSGREQRKLQGGVRRSLKEDKRRRTEKTGGEVIRETSGGEQRRLKGGYQGTEKIGGAGETFGDLSGNESLPPDWRNK